MRKKGYKQMQKRLYREKSKAAWLKVMLDVARDDRIEQIKRADYFQERIRMIGANMDTKDITDGKIISMVKWTISPEAWGAYSTCDLEFMDPAYIKEQVVNEIAKGLVEKEMVQWIVKEAGQYDPLSRFGTIGGKVYVVPWEQIPHTPTLELRAFQDTSKFYKPDEKGTGE